MSAPIAVASSSLVPRQLSLPGKTLPPSIPLIISSQDNWDPDTYQLETDKTARKDTRFKLVEDALMLLRAIDKPLAVLSICGPYRSGKSYFISRVLGRPGAFKLGHSMQACTRGIWMATTVLECQEFATVLLDTEGIDAVGASETMAMSLLTLSTLLSSFLIYNSKKVPQKVDLTKMKCFTQMSTSLLAQIGESTTAKAMKSFFPHFLWLLRDVSLKMTDKEGREIEPTEFLHSRILKGESGKLTELGKSLVGLFPCLECATLPIPSIKREIIRNIVDKQNELKPKFNMALDNFIQKISHQLSPKKATDGVTLINGRMLASLASGYVEAINRPGAVPDLDQGWQAVVRLEIKQHCYKLVAEYKKEMRESLEGNIPMEESHLMRLHHETLSRKKKAFQEEIKHVNPLHSNDEQVVPLLSELEREVVQWNDEGKPVVVGGVLFHFITENFTASKAHCEKVFSDLVQESNIEAKTNKAILDSEPLDISQDISAISASYGRLAVGPAATEVMERGQLQLQQLRDTLKMIPGKPLNLKEIGVATDRIKLGWDQPEHNPEVVEFYIVSKRDNNGQWEDVKTTEKTRALITGLKCNTDYEFQVRATNALIESVENETGCNTEQKYQINRRDAKMAARAAASCSYSFPTSLLACHVLTGRTPGKFWRPKHRKLVTAALLPLNIVISPITVPMGAIAMVKLRCRRRNEWGDLTEE